MKRSADKFLAIAIVTAPLLCAAPAYAGGAGNCGGTLPGLAGTETCGAVSVKEAANWYTDPELKALGVNLHQPG